MQDDEECQNLCNAMIETILKTYGMSRCKKAFTPFPTEIDLTRDFCGDLFGETTYWSLTGSLLHFSNTIGSDIACVVGFLSILMRAKTAKPWETAKNVHQYLRIKINLWTSYFLNDQEHLLAFGQSDWIKSDRHGSNLVELFVLLRRGYWMEVNAAISGSATLKGRRFYCAGNVCINSLWLKKVKGARHRIIKNMVWINVLISALARAIKQALLIVAIWLYRKCKKHWYRVFITENNLRSEDISLQNIPNSVMVATFRTDNSWNKNSVGINQKGWKFQKKVCMIWDCCKGAGVAQTTFYRWAVN